MKIAATAAALALAATLPAHAESMSVTETSGLTVIEGVQAKPATIRETTTVSAQSGYTSTEKTTSISTADYDKNFTDSGEPKYMPNVTFDLK